MQKQCLFSEIPGELNPQKAIRAAILTPQIHTATIDDESASIVIPKVKLPQQTYRI
jgi:hypothetical protein